MKVLHVAQYIYSDDYSEFQRSKTGLGIMVNDICRVSSQYNDTFLFTHAITNGHKESFNIVKHTWADFICGIRINNFLLSFRYREYDFCNKECQS